MSNLILLLKLSLLIKCQTLESIKNVFRKICIICMSPSITDQCSREIDLMQEMIKTRPVDKFDRLIETSFTSDPDADESVVTSKSLTASELQENEKEDKRLRKMKKEKIKRESPFTIEFINIQKEVQLEISKTNEGEDQNPLFNPGFIDHLNNKYMPY